jgi:hypothetical protein
MDAGAWGGGRICLLLRFLEKIKIENTKLLTNIKAKN